MFGGTSTFSSGFGPSDFGNTSDISDTFLPPRKENSAKSTQEIKKQKSLPIHEISTSPFGEYTYFFIYIPQLFNIQLKLYKRAKNQKTIFFQTFLRIRVHPDKPPIKTKPVVCVSQDPVINCGYALDFSEIPPKDLSSHCPVIELYYISEKGETLLGTAILPLKVNQVLNIYGKPLKYLYRNEQINIEDFLSRKVGSALVTIALGFEEHIEYFRKIQTGSIPEELVPIADENHPQNAQNAKLTTTSTTTTTTMKSSVNQFRQNAIDGDSAEYVKPQTKQHVVVSDEDVDEENEEEEDDEDEKSKRRHRHRHRRHHHKKNKTDWMQQAILLGWKPPGTLTGNWKEKAASKGWKPPIMKSSIALQFNYHDAAQLRDNDCQTDPATFQQLAELNKPQEEEATSEISSSGVGSLINFLNGAQGNQPNPKHVMSQFEDESSALLSNDEPPEQAKPKFEIIRPTQLFNHEPDFAESTNTLETTSENLIDDLPDLDIVSVGTDSQLINHMSTDREDETQNKPILQTQHILSQKPLSLSDDDDDDSDIDIGIKPVLKPQTNVTSSPDRKQSPSPTMKIQSKIDLDDIDDVDDSDDSDYIEQLMKQLDVNVDSDDNQQFVRQKIVPRDDSDEDDDDSDDDDARDVQRAMQKRYFGEI